MADFALAEYSGRKLPLRQSRAHPSCAKHVQRSISRSYDGRSSVPKNSTLRAVFLRECGHSSKNLMTSKNNHLI